MKIPKTAYIDISTSFDLDKWLTEDDKEILLKECKNEFELDIKIRRLIRKQISSIVNYHDIFIDLI